MLQGEAKPLGVKRHGARDILHLIAKSVDGIDDDGWTDWRRLSLHGGRLLACACIDRRADPARCLRPVSGPVGAMVERFRGWWCPARSRPRTRRSRESSHTN